MATRRSLTDDFQRLGVQRSDVLMVHAGLRAVGAIVGGANVLLQALFDVLGPEGTLIAYVDFEPFYDDDSDPASVPIFDKRIAPAARDHGALHEVIRNWPGALRSDHPDAGVAAIGKLADWITSDHPFQYGYGPGSPFEKFVQANGKVLMLGAPLDTITLLHYAEHMANIPGKRIHRYCRKMPGQAGPVWVDFEEFDTREPVCDHLPSNCFERIAADYLANGLGASGRVGEADSYLLDGQRLVAFAIDWLERFVAVK